jgi:uncharacterized protein (TIGR02217 family)
MSTQVLPSLVGLGFDVVRTPLWDTTVQTAVSGKETRIARQLEPRWRWELSYNVLRSAAGYNELQQLAGFFNARKGKFDTFLYQDADDNTVTNQTIGQGTGSKLTFPLLRSFGGFNEFMLAPNSVSAVYINGVVQSSGWTVSMWGAANPGVITFTTPPANNAPITADFSYYFPCRMSEDSVSFSLFISQHYRVKKFSFISVKN